MTATFEPAGPGDFARWLAEHGASEREVWLVYQKKATGKQAVSFEQTLAEALCYGWIDSKSKTLDAERFSIRWTPRRPGGNWSAANCELAKTLIEEGRMTDAGVAVLPENLR